MWGEECGEKTEECDWFSKIYALGDVDRNCGALFTNEHYTWPAEFSLPFYSLIWSTIV